MKCELIHTQVHLRVKAREQPLCSRIRVAARVMWSLRVMATVYAISISQRGFRSDRAAASIVVASGAKQSRAAKHSLPSYADSLWNYDQALFEHG
jgi:hypothetical protein